MVTKEFDAKFQRLFTSIVETSFEYVGRSKEEIDRIFIYASMEDETFFFNVFYLIKGNLSKANTVNEYLTDNPATPEMNKQLLRVCTGFVDEISELFEADEREVPTLIKMTFEPKTGAFDSDISYKKFYSEHPERTEVDGFNEWFEDVKAGL